MAEHADGWKDEEGDVDSQEVDTSTLSKDADLKDVSFTFIMKDLTQQDILDILERIKNYFGVEGFGVHPA